MPDRRLPTSTACFRPRAAAATTSSPVTSTRPEVKYWGPINEIYAEFFGDHRPARVVSPPIFISACLVEIEAVAEVPDYKE